MQQTFAMVQRGDSHVEAWSFVRQSVLPRNGSGDLHRQLIGVLLNAQGAVGGNTETQPIAGQRRHNGTTRLSYWLRQANFEGTLYVSRRQRVSAHIFIRELCGPALIQVSLPLFLLIYIGTVGPQSRTG
jgi:hypothetical protein